MAQSHVQVVVVVVVVCISPMDAAVSKGGREVVAPTAIEQWI
jgi:hypothetical protein